MAYYLDFGNSNPHYLVPNCSAINLESNDGNHKRFAIIHVTRVGQVQGGYLAKSGSFSTSMVTIRNIFCALTISLEYRTSATGLWTVFHSGNHSCGTCGTVRDGSKWHQSVLIKEPQELLDNLCINCEYLCLICPV